MPAKTGSRGAKAGSSAKRGAQNNKDRPEKASKKQKSSLDSSQSGNPEAADVPQRSLPDEEMQQRAGSSLHVDQGEQDEQRFDDDGGDHEAGELQDALDNISLTDRIGKR